jgi:hypothetical protein
MNWKYSDNADGRVVVTQPWKLWTIGSISWYCIHMKECESAKPVYFIKDAGSTGKYGDASIMSRPPFSATLFLFSIQ